MATSKRRFVTALGSLVVLATVPSWAAEPSMADRKPGDKFDDAVAKVDAKLIRPAGRSIGTKGSPLDLAVVPGSSLLVAKTDDGLSTIDIASMKKVASFAVKKSDGSMHGLAVTAAKAGVATAWYTDTGKQLVEVKIAADGTMTAGRSIALTGKQNWGVALSKDGALAYVCESERGALAVVDLATGKVRAELPVGVAPYGVALSPDGSVAWVTDYGGRHPGQGHEQEDSAGQMVSVDKRSIPDSGTVSRVDLRQGKISKQLDVGLHPTQIVGDAAGKRLYVANANSDTVTVIDATGDGRVVETIPVQPDPALSFGSIPDGLSLSPDGRTLYVADGGNDAVAVVAIGANGGSKVKGFIPAGWFPGCVLATADHVFTGNIKSDSVTVVDPPTDADLPALTKQVLTDEQVPQILLAQAKAASPVPAVPVPAQWGAPSVFKHVVFVLKENKTYDQVLGDIGKGNSDPKLCTYGKTVTPNQHALAEQFVLLDNYYCNGVNSSEGHQWATQGIITDYFEKGSRTYDFGTDALCYAYSDFIWDSCLTHGLSIRNYGEFDFPANTTKPGDWFTAYNLRDQPGKVTFKQSLQLQTLKRYTSPEFPGWNLALSDAMRIKVFLKEFAGYERRGDFPAFVLLYLPQDHTSGTKPSVPTPRAMVADNDLATGLAVEAISHSRFWKDTCIIINEDDPQSGYDHVDGHRSICMVASPYTKRHAVVSRFYNQTSVMHTMTRMLGLPPLNQETAVAPTMEDCFVATPDPTPFTALPNQIPLDEHNKPKEAMTPDERKLADAVDAMDFDRPDRADEDKLNRLIWLASGNPAPYPAEFAGPHGKGLAALHLKLDTSVKPKDDDDD
jgi:YVTN family beta-propeller protein